MRWSVFFLFACLGSPQMGYSAPEADDVVAKVGTEEITAGDLQRAMQRLRLRFGDHAPLQALQPLVDRKILKLEAEEKALDEDSLVVAALERIARQRLTEKLYEEEVSKTVVISTAEIQTYFYQHGLDRKREVRASHIVVETEEEAWRVYRQLKEGADFAALAREVSIDTSTAAQQGDMGYWQEEDTQRSPFVRQLYALQTGEISEPYQDTRGSYHLIKATEERPVGFERQRKRIQQLLERQQKDQRWRVYLEEQAESLQCTVDETTLALLLRLGRRAVERIPPIPPEHSSRVLCRYQGGTIDVEAYISMIKGVDQNSRPAPVDSASIVQFVRSTALTTEILPRIARQQGWKQEKELRAELEGRREEAMVEMLRRMEVEEPILSEKLLRAYYENHREEFTVPARTLVEGGILTSAMEAQAVAARARSGEELAEIMRSYPMFLGRWRKYDVFNFSTADTTRRKDALGAMIEAAREMESGEIKGPVEIRFEKDKTGFVVLKVLEKQPSRLRPFTTPEVRKAVRGKVRAERYREIDAAFEQYLATLRQKYASQVVVYQHVLDTLSTD